MKIRKFDCVEMMHSGAERVRRHVEGMTLEQEAAYWRQKTRELRKLKREMGRIHKAS